MSNLHSVRQVDTTTTTITSETTTTKCNEGISHRDNTSSTGADTEHVEPSQSDVWGDAGDPSGSQRKYISVLSAFMLLTTWSTSSSNVLYPYTFGILGVAGGPLFMFLAFFVQWRATRWTVQAARATNAQTFGALGETLVRLFCSLFIVCFFLLCACANHRHHHAGNMQYCPGTPFLFVNVGNDVKVYFVVFCTNLMPPQLGRWGRILFEGSQILFQQLFLPVAIVLCAAAIQNIAANWEFASCNGNVVGFHGSQSIVELRAVLQSIGSTGPVKFSSALLKFCILPAFLGHL